MQPHIYALARTPKDLGSAIRRARMEQGLTQEGLAKLSGVLQKTISKIETGSKRAHLETVFALMAALKLDMNISARQNDPTALEDIF